MKSSSVLSKCSISSSNPKLSISWDRLTCFPSEGNSLCNWHSTDWTQDLHLSMRLCSWVRSFYEKRQTYTTSSFGNTRLRNSCLPFFYTSWPSLIFARFLISPSVLFLALHVAGSSLFVQAQLCEVNGLFAPSLSFRRTSVSVSLSSATPSPACEVCGWLSSSILRRLTTLSGDLNEWRDLFNFSFSEELMG